MLDKCHQDQHQFPRVRTSTLLEDDREEQVRDAALLLCATTLD
jgi:hypothetical protein